MPPEIVQSCTNNYGCPWPAKGQVGNNVSRGHGLHRPLGLRSCVSLCPTVSKHAGCIDVDRSHFFASASIRPQIPATGLQSCSHKKQIEKQLQSKMNDCHGLAWRNCGVNRIKPDRLPQIRRGRHKNYSGSRFSKSTFFRLTRL